MSTNEAGLIALVVDDELPALSDLGVPPRARRAHHEVITASSTAPGRCSPRRARRRRRVREHLDAGARRDGPGQVISRFADAPDRLRHRPRPARRRRVRPRSHRLRPLKPVRTERLSRQSAGSYEPATNWRPRPPRRRARRPVPAGAQARVAPGTPVPTGGRDDPGRAGWGHPVHHPQPDPLRPGPRRLRPATPRPGRTSCACRSACSRSAGPSISCASTAAPSSPSPT